MIGLRATKGLYAITTDSIPEQQFTQAVEQALIGGAALIQYRNKNTQIDSLQQAMQLQKLCLRYQVPLIINDDIALAKQCNAGVHLGQHDVDLQKARALLGDEAIIGVSCYNQMQRAEYAEKYGASYVAFGSMYPSTTKPNAIVAGLDILQQAKQKLSLPICAIGGINCNNAQEVIAAGADFIAVISGVFEQVNVQSAAKQFVECFN